MNSSVVVKIIFALIVVFFVGLGGFLTFYPEVPKSPEQQVAVLFEAEGDFNENDLDGAIKNAERVLRADDKNVVALLALASSWAQKGSIEFKEKEYGQKAIGIAREALDIDPQNAEAYRVIGYANEIMQQYEQAYEAYGKAIELDPDNALALSNRGHAYDLEGNLAKAKADYLAALLVDPELDHALINMARVSLREDNVDEASDYITTLLDVTLNDRFIAEGHQILGLISLGEGGFTEAISHFESSLAIDDSVPQSLVGLAEAKYYMLADANNQGFDSLMQEIFASLEKAMSINPNNTTALVVMAKALNLIGDSDNAKNLLEEALEAVDNDITLTSTEKDALRDSINNELLNI